MQEKPASDRIFKVVYTSHTEKLVKKYLDRIRDVNNKFGIESVKNFVGANLWKYFEHEEITDFEKLTVEELLQGILRTKEPMLMAEQKREDEKNLHNRIEDEILGDIATITEVKAFNNGAKSASGMNQSELTKKDYKKPHKQILINISAPVLKKNLDVDGIISKDGKTINDEKYNEAIERILLPALLVQNQICKDNGKKGIITIPGVGCGAFAGIFKGQVEAKLITAIQKIFEKYGDELSEIHGIVMDTYNKSEYGVYELNESTGAKLVVAPSHKIKVQKGGYKCLAQLATDKERADYFNSLPGNKNNKINKDQVLGVTIIAGDKFSCIGNELNKVLKAEGSSEPIVVGGTDVQEVHSGIAGRYDKDEKHFVCKETKNGTYAPAFESKKFEILTINDESKAYVQLPEVGKGIEKPKVKSEKVQFSKLQKSEIDKKDAEKILNDAVESVSLKQVSFAMGAGFLVGAAVAGIAFSAGAALPVYATVAIVAAAITVVSAILIQRSYFPDKGSEIARF